MKKLPLILGIFMFLIIGTVIYGTTINQSLNYKDIGKLLANYSYDVVEKMPGQKGSTDNFSNIRIYKIDEKETVSLLEYRSSYSAKKDLISLSGPLTEWVTIPHFFYKSKFVIVYVGENEKLISDLEIILGKQFIPRKD